MLLRNEMKHVPIFIGIATLLKEIPLALYFDDGSFNSLKCSRKL
jgi:hypothetical protein